MAHLICSPSNSIHFLSATIATPKRISSLILPIGQDTMPSLLPLALLAMVAALSSSSVAAALQTPPHNSSSCYETCGELQPHFPFYINNSSCGWSDPTTSSNSPFQLSCINSTTLYLNLDTQNHRVLDFHTDGILVDFPGLSSICRPYNDLNSFMFSDNNHFAISNDNVVGLYDCEDSSLCKTDCESNSLPGCDGSDKSGPSCCYPLSDHTVWRNGDGFDVFNKYECRGFSCWVVNRGSTYGKRGVKLEWGLPAKSEGGVCAENARIVNSTAVKHGIRCVCDVGFSGDGFLMGTGCVKSCTRNGKEAYGDDCQSKTHSKKKLIILAALLSTVLLLTSLAAILYLFKHFPTNPTPSRKKDFKTTLSFRKTCRTRLFTLHELERATDNFADSNKLLHTTTIGSSVVYSGLLDNEAPIVIQTVHCRNEKELLRVLSHIELLTGILHCHMGQILGCCVDSGFTPMVVYEFPENGTLEENLGNTTKGQQMGNGGGGGLDWYKRLTIAAQTASTLAFLQNEISPPVLHRNLTTACIFLDEEFSVKLACFELLNPQNNSNAGNYCVVGVGSNCNHPNKNDVYDLGLVLLEIISGKNQCDMMAPNVAIQKIRDGKLGEFVDPLLYYHEQPAFRREQIEIVADVGMRCLLFGGEGKIGMVDVAKELVHVAKDSLDGGSKRGPALEETFSNSSLLQMISLSPDSIYGP